MASIRKLPSGNYQVQIRLKNLDPIVKSFKTKKNAEAFARTVEADTELLRKLGTRTTLSVSFSDLADEYLSQFQGRDLSNIGRINFWRDKFFDKQVTSIDEYMIDEVLVWLYGNRSGSTVNRYKAALSAIFNYFIQHPKYKRLGFTNPLRKEAISKFPENPARQRFLNEDEQKRLLSACKQAPWDKLYLFVLMALTTGARRGELLGLKWSDIDFKERLAYLPKTKNGKPRLLPLTQSVVEEMMKYRDSDVCLVFNNSVSNFKPYDPKKSWAIALKKAGLKEVRIHDLRHTAASNLVKAGRTLFEVGVLLGHSSTSMTARYAHLAINDTKNMVDEVMGLLR